MIIPSVNKGIYEHIVRDRAGRLMRVRFEVVDVDGALKGRIISAEPVLALSGAVSAPQKQSCLPVSVIAKIAEELAQTLPVATPSPYRSLLEFFLSQPTRAPSCL